jgi:hypothetical protein
MTRFALPAALIAALAFTGAANAGPNDPLPVPDKKAQIQSQMGPSTPAANPTMNVPKAAKARGQQQFGFAQAGQADMPKAMKVKSKAKAKAKAK